MTTKFVVKKVERQLDAEGKEKRVLLYLDKNNADANNLLNSTTQVVAEYSERMRR